MNRLLPIVFNTEMIMMILCERKTVTRLIYEPPYQPGDILYVKELSMPKKAPCIFLKVKSLKEEKLQDITAEEVRKEGIGEDCIGISACGGGCETCTANMDNYVSIYSMFWNSTNIKMGIDIERYGYAANPQVWRIEFEQCEKPKNYIILKIIEIVKKNWFSKRKKEIGALYGF